VKEPALFSLSDCPLEGSNLIEASAGTGKTHAIAGLFLRLLLEKGLGVDRILVVTFTEAATAELKDRIRSKIREALRAFSGGTVKDEFLTALAAAFPGGPGDPRQTLLRALRSFDQAAIFTIHGFCRGMLRDRAFESGGLFDTELVTDQSGLKREIVEDFWRKTLNGASPLFVDFLLTRNFFPGDLEKILPNDTARWNLEVLPDDPVPDTAPLEELYRRAFADLARCWESRREEIEALLRHDSLKKNVFTGTRVLAWIRDLEALFSSGEEGFDAAAVVGCFTIGKISSALKKGCAFPEHPFFSLCDRFRRRWEDLLAAFEAVLADRKRALILGMGGELDRRKGERNVQSFDDLLTRFHDALEGPGGEVLGRSVRERFQAALIDEFQDTDPIQYNIFRTLFGSGKAVLFLIGDPKQAIYGFRGADIFTYMAAASEAEHRYTLDRNWRSTPLLVRGVNALFSPVPRPFVFSGIAFPSVNPARPPGDEPAGDPGAPLRIWFLPAPEPEGPEIAKGDARRVLSRAVGREIRRLLGTGFSLRSGTKLHEGDMAVLVRTNREARIVEEELKRQGIRGVLYSTGSIFHTWEALEMERVLRAAAEPEKEGLLRAALATDLFGSKGEDLWALLEEGEGWEAWLVRFREYRDLWRERGFMAMFQRLLEREEGIVRLMGFPDGERRVTNVLHLSELLHREEVEGRRTADDLVRWLSRKRDRTDPEEEREEDLLRLESDGNAVRIVTVHKSKGLQYPVVFCPFPWEGVRSPGNGEPVYCHDPGRDGRPVLDLGTPEREERVALAETEGLAEALRLFYVALTRARERCYFAWGRVRDGGTSAPAWLLHHRREWEAAGGLGAMEDWFSAVSDEDLRKDLESLAATAPGAVELAFPPGEEENGGPLPEEKTEPLAFRPFPGAVDASWRLASYSSLLAEGKSGPETADRDGIPGEEPRGEERGTADPLPKGTGTGLFFHDLLEQWDFTWTDGAAGKDLVEEKLRTHGLDPSLGDTVLAMVRRILSTPLDPLRPGFTLSRIPPEHRLNELEFHFPLKWTTPEGLRSLFLARRDLEPGPAMDDVLGGLRFSPARGFMRGFIDLVFLFEGKYYLVDWKSNFLGEGDESYGPAGIARAMAEHRYALQYTLYTVALDRYLALRLPGYEYDTHFGGVFYLFLRGIDPERGSGYGIFRDRPPGAWIGELARALVDFGDGEEKGR
jgi:exodeoxyribonuclease V beta subunit